MLARSAVPPKQELGAFGEQLAAEELERAGMPILDRNWTSRYGEIDIVAREGTTLVIVEVKTRRSVRYGTPLEAVPDRKVRRLRRLTGLWRQAHADILGWVRDVRIDVMGVRYFDDRPPVIEHVRGVS